MEKGGVFSSDGNQAAAHVAYALSEVSFLFPITPATPMGELSDAWAANGRKNVWGQVVEVTPMQSEAGVAGAIHGAAAMGACVSSFTCSQGLLLFLPNMFKIAGELTSCVLHVASRAVGGHTLAIYCAHNDVMAVRTAGWAILNSCTTQESADMALVSHIATLKTRVPFLHFFDGFRTSHEICKVDLPSYDSMGKLVPKDALQSHKDRALNPLHPHVRGTITGADCFMQEEEAANKYYDNAPEIVEEVMRDVEKVTGRAYHCFDYYGHPEADRVVVVMGSGAPIIEETIDYMHRQNPATKVGLIKVRLFRPWSFKLFLQALPKTCKSIAVLDRTKEAGASGEPLFLDVSATISAEGLPISVVGGRFGLGGKEFTPACVMAVYDNLSLPPAQRKRNFTVGIIDDVTHLSLPMPKEPIGVIPETTKQCIFYGIGSDGTVGANHDAIKIIGDNTKLNVQGYFFYDAHKSGGMTVSHLRFGEEKIKSEYLIISADYVAVHLANYVKTHNVSKQVKANGTFCLNCPWTDEELNKVLPGKLKRDLAAKKAQFWAIDATKIAEQAGLGKRINTVMQAAFFRLSGVLPFEQALELLKNSVAKTYHSKGPEVVSMNIKAIEASTNALRQVHYPVDEWLNAKDEPVEVPVDVEPVPEFFEKISRPSSLLEGDNLPVSTFQAAQVNPLGLTKHEKRGVALSIPTWDDSKCTHCNECSLVCPHAAIRPFLLTEEENAKAGFPTAKGKGKSAGYYFRVQVSAMDCTGCGVCAQTCKVKALTMEPFGKNAAKEAQNWRFVMKLPNRANVFGLRQTTVGSQYQQPLLEFSGCCEGCGETPYVKLLTQVFGERMVIANASGCSSVWGGTSGSVPYCTNEKGEGVAWGNSLFEDNAEYGFGMAKANTQRREYLKKVIDAALKSEKTSEKVKELLTKWLAAAEDADKAQELAREIIPLLTPADGELYANRDQLVKMSFWIVGGDGWAYDIDSGGLDHVVAMGHKCNILILDTEMYSNTGGQRSKSTNLGAIAKFASGGNKKQKKDLGFLCMSYGDVYVASVSLHANAVQCLKAMTEAESFPGTSVILAYAPCKEHGFPMNKIVEEAKAAVESGYWPLYRYDPRKPVPMQLDSHPKTDVKEFMLRENRYAALARKDEELAKTMFAKVEAEKKATYEKRLKMAQATTEALKADLPK